VINVVKGSQHPPKRPRKALKNSGPKAGNNAITTSMRNAVTRKAKGV